MHVLIKIQHLASIREVAVNPMETLQHLKERIENLYSIPAGQQSLTLDDRNISTSSKMLNELGLKDGSVVVVKKIHKFSGHSKGTDIGSLMKNPMIKGMMKNPDMIKSIQEMFPDLKEEMSQNKTLNMMMNSGGLEEELERMSMDSDYMSTQLRNADVTMAKLENIPGGINMMSGMMKEAEDPFKMLNLGSDLKGGNEISSKMTASLPGSSKRNLLVEYRKQLSELRQFGFDNLKENIEILDGVDGDLEAALEILIKKDDNF